MNEYRHSNAAYLPNRIDSLCLFITPSSLLLKRVGHGGQQNQKNTQMDIRFLGSNQDNSYSIGILGKFILYFFAQLFPKDGH